MRRKRNPDDPLAEAIGNDRMFVAGEAPDPIDTNEQVFYIATGTRGVNYTLRVKSLEWIGGYSPRKIVRNNYVANLSPNAGTAVEKVRKMFSDGKTKVYWTPIDLGQRAAARSSDVFRFGKYEGFTIEKVLATDPGYIAWLLDGRDANVLTKDKYKSFRREIEKYETHPAVAPFIEEKASQRRRDQDAREEQARREEERLRRHAQSTHVGRVGDKVELDVTLTGRACWDGYYGQKCAWNFIDDDLNQLVWFTSGEPWFVPGDDGYERQVDKGEHMRIKGTIKEHGEYKDAKQTILTRVKMVKFYGRAGATSKAGNPGSARQDRAITRRLLR